MAIWVTPLLLLMIVLVTGYDRTRIGKLYMTKDVNKQPHTLPQHVQRAWNRVALNTLTSSALVGSLLVGKSDAKVDGYASGSIVVPSPSIRPQLYSVEYTNPPCLQPRSKIGEIGALKRLSNVDILLVGDHSSNVDKAFETVLLDRMVQSNPKPITLGIVDFINNDSDDNVQLALDEYIQSSDSIEACDERLYSTLKSSVSVELFNSYKPMLHYAKTHKFKLVPFGTPVSINKRVLVNGLGALSEEEKAKYVPDLNGFVESVKQPGFRRYTDNVIIESFATNNVDKTVTPEQHFSLRILQDEAIAAKAASYSAANSNQLLVLISPLDRVIFGYGIYARIKRYQQLYKAGKEEVDAKAVEKESLLSLVINPTATDSLSAINQLQLTLGYGKYLEESYVLSDFIWFSEYPMVKLLTRPKNPINAEGEKPEGEGSVLKAF